MAKLFVMQVFILGCLCSTGAFVQAASLPTTTSSEHIDQKLISKVHQFTKDLELYVADPSWILPFFLSCSLQEFDEAWPVFVKIITRSCPQQFFVNDRKKNLGFLYELLVAHCQVYDQFLRDTVIDTQQHTLVLTGNKVSSYTKQPGIITLFQYWQVKKSQAYQDFYAFYFDAVAALYIQNVIDASLQNDVQGFVQVYKKAFGLYRQLAALFTHLQNGAYDQQYAHHLARFGAVLMILQDQHKALKGG